MAAIPATAPDSSNVAGIILAAGTASRMGRDKLLLPFKGIPLVQHVLNTARASRLTSVTVVLPEDSLLEERLSHTGCIIAHSLYRHEGQAESLKAGLRSIPQQAQGAMILLGDLPLLTAETINTLITASAEKPDHWIIPMQQGRRGNPVIIPSSSFEKVLTLAGDTGARPLLSLPDTLKHTVELTETGPFFDIDTPQQYETLLSNYE